MKYCKTDRYILRNIAGIYMLVDTKDKALFRDKIPTINETAKNFIDTIDKYNCFSVDMIIDEYLLLLEHREILSNNDANNTQCLNDANKFIEQLAEIGYLHKGVQNE